MTDKLVVTLETGPANRKVAQNVKDLKMATRQSGRGNRFHLDDHRLDVPDARIEVSVLRHMASPPIADTHEIWCDVDGGKDRLLDEGQSVKIKAGDIFYSRGPDGAHPRPLRIVINDDTVDAPAISLTGDQIRNLATSTIPDSHRLYRDVDGSRDERVGATEVVTIRYGAEFYSVAPFFIIVNGREKTNNDLEDHDLTFDELITLAFDSPPTGPQVTFTVTYRKGHQPDPEGSLVQGQSVKAKKGMIFNVTSTDKS